MITTFKGIRENEGRVVQVSEELYDDAMGAVPPLWMGDGFAMGEVYDHDERGAPVYYCFHQDCSGYFATLATIDTAQHLFATALEN